MAAAGAHGDGMPAVKDAGSGRNATSDMLIGLGVAAAGLRMPFAEREPVTDARVQTPGSVGALLSLLVACVACVGGAGDARWAGEPLRGQTVDVAGLWSGPDQAKMESALVRFEQETGVTVRYTAMGPGITAALATRVKEGTPPDVAILPSRASLADLARRGALRPLGERVEDLVRDNYAPAWRDQGSVEGTLFGVWVKAVNKSTIWYNASSLREAGIDVPVTWDEFLTGARAMARAGITPLSIAGGDGWPLTDWFENVYLRMAGPERYDQLSEHAIPWTDESVMAALSLLGELWGDRTLIVDGAATTDVVGSVDQINQTPPKGAIAYGGGLIAGAGEEARLSGFPSIHGTQNAVVGNGDVAVRLTDDAPAVALMEFLASPKFGDAIARFRFLSPNRNVNLGFYPDDATRRSARALVEADTFRFDLSDLQPVAFGGTPGQGMWRILQDFLGDPSDVAGTARQLEAAAAEAFDR